jgi:hypothetical protein
MKIITASEARAKSYKWISLSLEKIFEEIDRTGPAIGFAGFSLRDYECFNPDIICRILENLGYTVAWRQRKTEEYKGGREIVFNVSWSEPSEGFLSSDKTSWNHARELLPEEEKNKDE